MGSDNKAGFTIIETMLFLGISGLLFVGIILGTGTSINVQRYRDSVTSLQSTLQQQFYGVANVDNERGDSLSCGGAIKVIGQSNCVILGKYITSNSGDKLTIKNVVGYLMPGTPLSNNDITAFNQYNIQTSPVASESYDIEWGTKVVKAGTNDPIKFSVLILRSPTNGIIRTFIDPEIDVSESNIRSLLATGPLTKSVNICMNSNDFFTGPRMSVMIDSNATGPTAVEVLGDNSGC